MIEIYSIFVLLKTKNGNRNSIVKGEKQERFY
jgi:hypothetical protein